MIGVAETMKQEIVDKVVEAVEVYYAENPEKPLLLSRFGQLHPELIKAIRDEGGTLVQAIALSIDRLKVVAPAETRGREAVVPANRSPEIERTINETQAAVRSHSSAFDGLPTSIQIAFCLRTEANEVVAVRPAPPFRYARFHSNELVRPGFLVIAEEYRRPGLALKNATAEDKDALWKGFLAWCEAGKLDPNTFARGQGSSALARLLAAQDPNYLSRFIIPADIAALLLKRP